MNSTDWRITAYALGELEGEELENFLLETKDNNHILQEIEETQNFCHQLKTKDVVKKKSFLAKAIDFIQIPALIPTMIFSFILLKDDIQRFQQYKELDTMDAIFYTGRVLNQMSDQKWEHHLKILNEKNKEFSNTFNNFMKDNETNGILKGNCDSLRPSLLAKKKRYNDSKNNSTKCCDHLKPKIKNHSQKNGMTEIKPKDLTEEQLLLYISMNKKQGESFKDIDSDGIGDNTDYDPDDDYDGVPNLIPEHIHYGIFRLEQNPYTGEVTIPIHYTVFLILITCYLSFVIFRYRNNKPKKQRIDHEE